MNYVKAMISEKIGGPLDRAEALEKFLACRISVHTSGDFFCWLSYPHWLANPDNATRANDSVHFLKRGWPIIGDHFECPLAEDAINALIRQLQMSRIAVHRNHSAEKIAGMNFRLNSL